MLSAADTMETTEKQARAMVFNDMPETLVPPPEFAIGFPPQAKGSAAPL